MRIFRDPVKANTNTPPVLSETQETVPVLKKVWLSVFKTTKSLFQYQAEPIENLRNRVHPLNRNLSCFLKKLIGPISAESIQTNIIASAGTSLSGLDSHKIEELLERTFLLIFDKISKMNDLEPITDLLEHFEELTRLPVITKKELNDKKNEIKSTKTAIKEAKRNLRQQTENEEPTRAIHAEIEELKSEIKNTSKKLLPARHKELRRQLGEKRRNLYINTRTRNADLIESDEGIITLMETLEAFKSDLEVLEKLRKKRLDFIKELWQCFFPNNDGMPQIPMRLGARLNKDIAAWIVRDFILEPVFVCIIQSLHTGHLSTNRNLLIDQIKEFGSSPLVIVRDIAARTSEFAIGILATDKLQADGTDGPEFIGKLLEIMIEDTSEVGGIIAEASARNAKGDAGGNISIEEISLEEYTTSVTNSFGELIKVLKELLSTGGSDSTIEPLAVHKLLPMMPFLQGRLEIIAEETLLHFTINLLNTITDNPSILTEIVNKASDVTYPRDLLSSEIMKLCFPTGSKEIAIYGSALQELIHEKLRKKVETYLIPRLAIKPKLELIRQESPQQDIDTAQSAAKLVARMAISKAENALSAPREFLAQQGENITSQITSTLKPLGELVSQTAFDSFSLNLEPQLTNWIAVLGEDSERIARRLKPLPAIISEPIQNTTEELLLVAMKNAKILLKKLYATDQDFIQKMLQDLCQPIKTHPAFDKGPEAIEEAQMEHARKWSAKLLPILIPLDSLPTPQKLSVQAYEQLRDNILPKILITAIKSLLEPANVSSMLIKALDEKSSTKKKTNTASQHLSFQEKLSLAFKGIKNDLGSFFTLNKTENIIKPMGKTKIIGKTAFSLVKKFFLINWAAALINKIIYIPQIILNKLGLLEETKDSEQILGEAISIQLRKSLSEYPIDTIIDKILNASKEWMNNELDKTDEQIQIEKENEKEITASLHQKAIEMLSKTLQRPFKISLEAIWDGLSSLLLKASQKIEEKIASVPIGFPILKNIPGIRNFRWIQTTKISQAASRLWNIFIVKLLDILIVKLPKPAIISIDRLILKPARTFLNIVSLGYLKRTIEAYHLKKAKRIIAALNAPDIERVLWNSFDQIFKTLSKHSV